MVVTEQRRYGEYFTKSDSIVGYMNQLLDIREGHSLLEPCVGEGDLIASLIDEVHSADLIDINSQSIKYLKKRFFLQGKNINIQEQDFLSANIEKRYDRIIANPPYGAIFNETQIQEYKKYFKELYCNESYILFLYKSLWLLKDKGKLVFIIPDTFLSLHSYTRLRKLILEQYTLDSITLFPSNFFPKVNFGYAGLAIISLINTPPQDSSKLHIYSELKDELSFTEIINKTFQAYRNFQVTQKSLLRDSLSYSFQIKDEPIIAKLFKNLNYKKLGDIAFVVTGFYSGDNKKYIKKVSQVTRDNSLETIEKSEIYNGTPLLSGIKNQNCFIPIVKGGVKRFYKPDQYYLNWSEEAILEYTVTNKKKARFQNSKFYFKKGLAVPMVSSNLSASLLENKIFDQSIVGIFLKEEYHKYLWYLLGFFNTQLGNTLVKRINITANNSANYLKKIPIILPNLEVLKKIDKEVQYFYSLAKKCEITKENLENLEYIYQEVYSH